MPLAPVLVFELTGCVCVVQEVRDFIIDAISHPDLDEALPRACMYIAGVPGVGKTASVMEVVRELLNEAQAGHVPAFQFAEVNALRLPSPQHIYSRLAEVLTGARLDEHLHTCKPPTQTEYVTIMHCIIVGWALPAAPVLQVAAQSVRLIESDCVSDAGQRKAHAAARNLLEELFENGRGSSDRVTVLLVDEIDMLLSRDQSVLYNLFGWPQQPGARLAVIGIANTLDLPERLLPKIARCGAEMTV